MLACTPHVTLNVNVTVWSITCNKLYLYLLVACLQAPLQFFLVFVHSPTLTVDTLISQRTSQLIFLILHVARHQRHQVVVYDIVVRLIFMLAGLCVTKIVMVIFARLCVGGLWITIAMPAATHGQTANPTCAADVNSSKILAWVPHGILDYELEQIAWEFVIQIIFELLESFMHDPARSETISRGDSSIPKHIFVGTGVCACLKCVCACSWWQREGEYKGRGSVCFKYVSVCACDVTTAYHSLDRATCRRKPPARK